MFARAGFSSVAEGRKNRLAFVPKGKLIGIVAAPRLAGLSGGNQQNGIVPIAQVCHKAHGRAMRLRDRAYAVNSSRLRFARNAEELFQESFAAQRMNHAERVGVFPSPILDTLAPTLLDEPLHRLVSGCGQQIVVALERSRQPLRRSIRKYPLQKRGRAPLIDCRFFSQERLKKKLYRCAPRTMQK